MIEKSKARIYYLRGRIRSNALNETYEMSEKKYAVRYLGSDTKCCCRVFKRLKTDTGALD